MPVCTKCFEEKSVSEFYKRSRVKSGYQSSCKSCMRISYQNSRHKKPEHYNKVKANNRNKIREQISDWKSSCGCIVCGESDSCCLDMHHTDPSIKTDDPSSFSKQSFEAFLKEAEKCVVLCSNCHRKVHANKLTLLVG